MRILWAEEHHYQKESSTGMNIALPLLIAVLLLVQSISPLPTTPKVQSGLKVMKPDSNVTFQVPNDVYLMHSPFTDRFNTPEGQASHTYESMDGHFVIRLRKSENQNFNTHPAKSFATDLLAGAKWYDFAYFGSIRSSILLDPLANDKDVYLLFATQYDDTTWSGIIEYPINEKAKWEKEALQTINSFSIRPPGSIDKSGASTTLHNQQEALSLMQKGQYSKAIIEFDKVIASGSAEELDFYNRAYCKQKSGHISGAISDYEIALIENPKNAQCAYNIGFCNFELNRFEISIKHFNIALKLDRKNARYYLARGKAEFETEDFEAAIADFSAVILLDPENAEAYCQRGFALLRKKQKDEGCADVRKAARLGHETAKKYARNYCR